MERRPRGYVGINHETIGSDLLAVEHSLNHLVGRGDVGRGQARSLVMQQILGPLALDRLTHVVPDGWYPIAWLLEVMETLGSKLGRFGLIKMGRALFKLSHEQRVLREATSGHDIVRGIDAMYHHANRGQEIGGWRLVRFDETSAALEKTTPHHSAMEEGILAQGLSAGGAEGVINQGEGFRPMARCWPLIPLPCAAD